jgi:hypothetical protein
MSIIVEALKKKLKKFEAEIKLIKKSTKKNGVNNLSNKSKMKTELKSDSKVSTTKAPQAHKEKRINKASHNLPEFVLVFHRASRLRKGT